MLLHQLCHCDSYVNFILESHGTRRIRVSLGFYPIVGVAGGLVGAIRMTISIFISVTETPGTLEVLVAIMMDTWVAKITSFIEVGYM